MASYRSDLVDGTLAWVVFQGGRSFRPVHEVVNHLDDGLVIIIVDEVFSIDEAPVYATRALALEVHYQEGA